MRALRAERAAAAVILWIAGAIWGSAAAQEHPREHPKEHPAEHPKSAEASRVTADDLAEAVAAWVAAESEKTGGRLRVEDTIEDRTLSLALAKVHRDKLARVGPQTYFACADFTAEDGTTYDLDIFMKGPDKDHLETTEVSVHKKNGKERYGWVEEGGVWKKRPVS